MLHHDGVQAYKVVTHGITALRSDSGGCLGKHFSIDQCFDHDQRQSTYSMHAQGV